MLKDAAACFLSCAVNAWISDSLDNAIVGSHANVEQRHFWQLEAGKVSQLENRQQDIICILQEAEY